MLLSPSRNQAVSECEVGEDAAAQDLGRAEPGVAEHAHHEAAAAHAVDQFHHALSQRHGACHALELLLVHEARQQGQPAAAFFVVADQLRLRHCFGLAGGMAERGQVARALDQGLPADQQQPQLPEPARQDVGQRRGGQALGLEHGHHLVGVQPAGVAGAGTDDARDFVGHGTEVLQRLAVVDERADVDLGQARATAISVDEQADVGAVIGLEIKLGQQRAARRDDQAQRLAEMRQLGEEDLQPRLGREFGNAPTAAAETGFDKVGAVGQQGLAEVADEARSQPAEVAVEEDHDLMRGLPHAVLRRHAFAELAAGDHPRTRGAGPHDGVVERAVVDDDDLRAQPVAERDGHHVGDMHLFVQCGHDHTGAGGQWQAQRGRRGRLGSWCGGRLGRLVCRGCPGFVRRWAFGCHPLQPAPCCADLLAQQLRSAGLPRRPRRSQRESQFIGAALGPSAPGRCLPSSSSSQSALFVAVAHLRRPNTHCTRVLHQRPALLPKVASFTWRRALDRPLNFGDLRDLGCRARQISWTH